MALVLNGTVGVPSGGNGPRSVSDVVRIKFKMMTSQPALIKSDRCEWMDKTARKPIRGWVSDFTASGRKSDSRCGAVSYTHLTLPTIYSV